MNLAKRMEARFPEKVTALLVRIGEMAAERGWRAYLVGGPVRDLILRLDNLDFDLRRPGGGVARHDRRSLLHLRPRWRVH